MALDRRAAGDPLPPVPPAALAWSTFIDGGAAGFREPSGCVGGLCAAVAALPSWQHTYAAGIDRRIVHSTSVRRAARNATDRHISRSCRTCGAPQIPLPPCPPRANEAAGGVKTMDNAIAIFSALLATGKLPIIH